MESRRLLASTTRDEVELVSPSDTYQGALPVWQRLLTTTEVVTALGAPAYDLRSNLPGDQTIRLAREDTTASPVQFNKAGDRVGRVLVDPSALYVVDYYWYEESTSIPLDAYDAAGRFLGRFQLGLENNELVQTRNIGTSTLRGYLGDPNMRGAMAIKLPSQTYLIEIQYGLLTSIGFAGDAFESGPSVIAFNEERSIGSTQTLELVEADEPILIQADKFYTLDASVTYGGTTNGVTHSVGYTAYDADGLRIEPKHVERFGSATDTKLASDLKPGDTFFDLVDAAGWSNFAGPETRALAWYGYTDALGRSFADYTYTRNVASDAVQGLWPAGAIIGNRITLVAPWSGPTIRAGTAVRNTVDQPGPGLFAVIAEQQPAPINAQAIVGGFRKDGFPDLSAFPPGTVSIRPAARLNEALQLNGSSLLSYRVSTRDALPVTVDTIFNTRSVLVDVVANDAVSTEPGLVLRAVTAPTFGTAQIFPGPAGTRPQVRYSTTFFFVGTDRFTYTLQRANGELLTETVIVSSLGGNLDDNPALQRAVSLSTATLESPVVDYGAPSYAVQSGGLITSRADNLNRLGIYLQPTSLPLTFSLTQGTQHGSLRIFADGTFTYQSEPGFVGFDTFQFTVFNGARSATIAGLFDVVATSEELDLYKVRTIAQGILIHESTYRRLYYSQARSEFDANGVPFLSWRVRILPFIGYSALYSQFKLDEPWNSANNLPLLNQMPDIFRSASDATSSTTTRFQAIKASPTGTTLHFMNNNGSPRATRISDVIHGIENSLAVVRAGTDKAVLWTKPDDLAFDDGNPLATLGNSPEPTIPVAFVDASGALMPKTISASTFTSIATIAQSPGVTGADGQTLMRAWSEQLVSPVVHARNYYVSQHDRMRDLGYAILSYESTFRALPLWGTTDASGNRLLSWRVMLLPYLGHGELYNRFNLAEPWDSPTNLPLLDLMPDVFRSASDLSSSNTTRLRLLNGPGTLYSSAVTKPRLSIVSDDTGKTIYAVEAGVDKAIPWTMPETLPLGTDFLSSIGQLTENWLRGVTVEGSPFLVATSTSNTVLQALATHNKGEVEGRFPSTSPGRTFLNLRSIGLAFEYFESAYRRYPVNLWGAYPFTKRTTAPTLSWRVAILPFIGENTLFNAFKLDEPWDSPHNLALMQYMPDFYRSNGMPENTVLTRFQMFTGSRTMLRTDGVAIRRADLTDGTSSTLEVVETGIDKAVPWTKPSDLDGDAIDLWQLLGNVGDTIAATTADSGSVLISKRFTRYLTPLVIRNDGGTVPAFEATQRIVIREGELAAIDLPTNSYTFDSPSLVQLSNTSFVVSNVYSGTRVTMQAIDNGVVDGVRVARLTANGRTIEIVILDDEGLSLSANPTSISEAGGQTTLTVSRPNLNLQSPLVVQIDSSHRNRLSVPASVTIPAGLTSVSFTVTAIDNFIPGDSESVRVTATADGLGASIALINVIDDESLQLSFVPASISEFGGRAIGILSRLGAFNNPLVVTLTHDRPDKAVLPTQVIIPAGQSSVNFIASAIDNLVYDGDAVVHVIASAAGYVDTPGSFTVTDYESIGMAISQTKISEADEVMSIVVSRTADSQGQPITVQLQTDRPDKVQLPASVVIPADAQRVTVQMRTIDNRLLDGLVHVRVQAHFGDLGHEYLAGATLIDVTDHEAFSLTMTPPQLSEKDGRSRGRLTRDNLDLDKPLTVSLVLSHPDLASVPDEVTIPIGAEYVEFDVDALDNNLIAPDTRVRLEAVHAAYLPESMTFVVNDFEPLSLSFAIDSGAEGATLTGIVTRNVSNLDQPVIVRLLSVDESEVEVPDGVIIPAGQRSASFTARLVRDRILDATQSANIVADADGYVSANASLTVTDSESISVILVDTATITEGSGVVFARLTRSDINSETVLNIRATSSNTNVGYLNNSLQIQAHQSSIDFPIVIVDDSISDGAQALRITFEVQDVALESVALDLQVEDDDLAWHNAANALDVDRNGTVTPLDALLVINYLNRFGGRPTAQLPPPDPNQPLLVDTSNDQNLSAIDALLIINYLNAHPSGEGEGQRDASSTEINGEAVEVESRSALPKRTSKQR